MEINIDTRELVALERRLAAAGKRNPTTIKRMLTMIGTIVQGKARAFAPRSMTKAEYVSTLVGGKTTQSADKFHPRQLKNSITKEVFTDRVEIGVPSNSLAADYAEKIHDEKGKSWKKVGWQNDSQATDKYIEKAEEATKDQYMKAVDDYVDSIIKAI